MSTLLSYIIEGISYKKELSIKLVAFLILYYKLYLLIIMYLALRRHTAKKIKSTCVLARLLHSIYKRHYCGYLRMPLEQPPDTL